MSDGPVSRHGLESLCVETGEGLQAGVELSVLADSGFLDLRADPERPDLMAAIAEVLGHPLPVDPNTISVNIMRTYWLGPDEWLVVGRREETRSRLGGLEAAGAVVNDLSGGYVRLQMAGDHVLDVLARGTPIDLHPREFRPGQCAQTGLAKANVLLGNLGETGIVELIVRRSFADYLYRWMLHVAHPFGLRQNSCSIPPRDRQNSPSI